MFRPGDRVELSYPIRTHVRLIEHCPRRRRQIIVRSVRDLLSEPLTPGEFMQRPYVARSRYLIRAWDITLQDFRQFYVGSSDEFAAPGTLRVATYLPRRTRPHRIVTEGYDATVRDRRELIREIQRLAETLARIRIPTELELRIIADDMRRVG